MEQQVLQETLEQLRDRLEHDDWTGAAAIIEALRPPDQAHIFGELAPDRQQQLLPQLDVSDSADILEKLEDEEAAELAEFLDVRTLARIVDEMEPDEAADLLGDLEPDQATRVLAGMTAPEDVVRLLAHEDETAGGLMTPAEITLRRHMTAAEAISYVRKVHPESETVYYLFVVDRADRLCGVVSLRQLIVADPDALIDDIMDPDVIYVKAGVDQEECADLISRYDLLALPVVDEVGRLLGVVTVDDVVDVLVDEASEDIHRMGASEPLAERYLVTSVLTLARKRAVWLLLLFVAETFTGTVLRHFEHELSTVVALAFFVPLLIGTGGNAGSQAATTVIRAMALGEVRFRDLGRVLGKEVALAIVLGLFIAGVGFARALAWGSAPSLSLTVAMAIVAIVLWANIVGSTVPILAHRVGIDPTVVSAPFVTTLVDATGLFVYFTIAKLTLGI